MKKNLILIIVFIFSLSSSSAQSTLTPLWDGFQRDIGSVHNNDSYFAQNGRSNIPLLKRSGDPRIGVFSFKMASVDVGLENVSLKVYNTTEETTELVLYAKMHDLEDSEAPTWAALNLTETKGDEVARLSVTPDLANDWFVFSDARLTVKVNEARLTGKSIALILDYVEDSGPTLRLENSNSGTPPVLEYTPRENEPLTSITLDGLSSMQNNIQQTLSVSLLPYYASVGTDLQWSSSKTEVATVVDGVVSSVGLGETVITATSGDGNVSGSFTVKVVSQVNVESVTITSDPFEYISIQNGINESLDQLEVEVLPSNAGNKNIVWSSSDDTIATVDENGFVKGLSEGTVTITATSVDGGYTTSRTLSVNEIWPMFTFQGDETPSPGRWVRVTPPEYQGTELYYTVRLPENWSATSGKRYPVFVDYPGIGSRSDNTAGGVGLGHILARKFEGIYCSMPIIRTDRVTQVDGDDGAIPYEWWGDKEFTSEYTQEAVRSICEMYNGDTQRLIIVGMSRGAVCTNYIGNYDVNISDMWRAYYSHDHFDGHRTIGGGSFPELWTGENEFFDKFSRVNGRPYLISNSTVPDVREFLSGEDYNWRAETTTGSGRDFVGIDNGITDYHVGDLTIIRPNIGRAVAGLASKATHTVELLRSRLDDAQFVFDWFKNVFENKIGVYSVSGKIVDENGNPIEGAIIEGGGVHFTISDANGNYYFEALPQGNRTISISEKNTFSFVPSPKQIDLNKNLTDINFAIDGSLGVSNYQNEILFYPNPTNKIITLSSDVSEVSITTISGKSLLKTTDLKTSSFDISSLAKGVYIIKMGIKDQSITINKKLIVN